MPVIFSAKLDGPPAVRCQPVSLVVFYLREARAHVSRALELPRGEGHFAEAMLAVVLSALGSVGQRGGRGAGAGG